MNTQQWANLLVWIAAPGATAFPLLYGLTATWWDTLAGKAVLVSKIGLALLVDASLLFQLMGRTYPFHDQIVLTAFGIITLGTYLYLAAYIHMRWIKRQTPMLPSETEWPHAQHAED